MHRETNVNDNLQEKVANFKLHCSFHVAQVIIVLSTNILSSSVCIHFFNILVYGPTTDHSAKYKCLIILSAYVFLSYFSVWPYY